MAIDLDPIHRSMSKQYRSICDALSSHFEQQPSNILYTFLDNRGARQESLTYESLYARVGALAAYVAEHSEPGEPVGCVAEPGLNFVVAFLACLWSGRIAVPMAPARRRRPDAVLAVMAHSGLTVCLCDSASLADTNAIVETASLNVRVLDINEARQGAHMAAPEFPADQVAYLQYTSGSTGVPKGVIVTHANLLANLEQIRLAFGHDRSSVGVIWLPPYHDMGLVGGILQPLYVGFPVYLMSPVELIRSPLTWLSAISRYRATTSGGPNFAYEQAARRIRSDAIAELDLASWRVAFCGAEPISAITLQGFARTFASAGFNARSFTPCYGLAEATLMVTCAPLGRGLVSAMRPDRRVDYVSCGRATTGCEIAIVEPETHQPVPEGGVGEIRVTGLSVSPGYWRDPVATSQAFTLDSGGLRQLRTGDLGFIENGELYVCGRLKSIAIIRGVNHSLEDIEVSARSAYPMLASYTNAAFVIGEPGEERVVVMQEAPADIRAGNSAEDAISAMREAVAQIHGIQLGDVVLVPSSEIARTRSGKVQRHACRDRYLQQRSAPAPLAVCPEME